MNLLACLDGNKASAWKDDSRGRGVKMEEPGSSIVGFSRREYWSGVPLPSPPTKGLSVVKKLKRH